ncbi:MAG: VanZ family protein [Bacteroidales bacterium]|jgi:VanZ family protein
MLKKNILTILTSLIIAFLSLASADTFNKIPIVHFRGIDKVVHFCMYAFFTAVILFDNRKSLNSYNRALLLSLVPFFFGALMELLQSWLTTTRTGSFFDLLFNVFGILFILLIYLFIRKSGKAGSD